MKKMQQKREMLTYAIAKDGHLVYIDKVKTGQKCACTCPACGEALIAKNNGSKRIHHFAHKSGVECEFAHESMLHLLAKERIQKAFLSSNSFLIDYVHKSYCTNYNQCKYTKCGDCYTKGRKSFNLKMFYDSCEQEEKYDGIKRRSDLKLFSSTNSNRKPVYIEFCVTHASEQEKLHCGSKIIECIIESEEDIDEIVKNGFVEDVQIKEDRFTQPKPSKAQFYGFKDNDCANTQITSEIAVNRCSLFKSGKMYCDLDYCYCKDVKFKKQDSLLFMKSVSTLTILMAVRMILLNVWRMPDFISLIAFSVRITLEETWVTDILANIIYIVTRQQQKNVVAIYLIKKSMTK